MPAEFFGHIIAAARFGCTQPELQEAINLSFAIAGSLDRKQVQFCRVRHLPSPHEACSQSSARVLSILMALSDLQTPRVVSSQEN